MLAQYSNYLVMAVAAPNATVWTRFNVRLAGDAKKENKERGLFGQFIAEGIWIWINISDTILRWHVKTKLTGIAEDLEPWSAVHRGDRGVVVQNHQPDFLAWQDVHFNLVFWTRLLFWMNSSGLVLRATTTQTAPPTS